jgi:hypothetical protein
MHQLDFGTWRGKERLKIAFTMNEDQIFNAFRTVCMQADIDRDQHAAP